MDVVAERKGKYGGRIRERGDKFTLNKGDKPGSWMVKANSAEAKAILSETGKGGGLTAAQIAQEQALATGRADASAELAAKDERIVELEKELETAKARIAELEAGEPDTEEPEGAGDGEPDGAGDGEPDGAGDGEPEQAERPKRRRRSR